ncbi:hypothetical protein [Rossellomorea sp. KS-H15a]|uniref:hypothetical protein n=1 Tax=Rossellomorea sp. KS-H15a TaxID=2963940 RepID=UPI0020C5F1B0|nr:hypothetical protein [Rossellomorea sp. KS-H15a]UTE77473.1 hypothetical protein M1J35_01250 [Rossellomorea sp. KS-H15a]
MAAKTGKRKAYVDNSGEKYLDCSMCKEIKSLDQFNNQKKGILGKASECKQCSKKRRGSAYKEGRGKQREERLEVLLSEVIVVDGSTLSVVAVNQRRTRKAYKSESGEVFLTCGDCKKVKSIVDYNHSPKGFYGKDSKCYECRRKKYFKYEKLIGSVVTIKNNNLKVVEVTERGRRKLTDNEGNVFLDCTKCKEIKPKEEYRDREGFLANKDSHCRVCCMEKGRNFRKENEEHTKEYYRQYREENKEQLNEKSRVHYSKNKDHIRKQQREYRKNDPERYREHSRKWARENPEYQVNLTSNRRAKMRRLPYDFTIEQSSKMLTGGCSLTGDKNNIHLDHVIPLNVGHGGTTFSNMIALRADLNNSKVDSNIFEWAEAKHKQFNFTLVRFIEVMTEVADRNGMSFEEYKEYVYWCFDNPRDLSSEPTNSERKAKDFYKRLDAAIGMYIKGETYDSIRNETRIVSNTLLRYLHEREIPTRKTNTIERPISERIETAVSMYVNGETIPTIRREAEIGQDRLYKALDERGIPRRLLRNETTS